MATSASVTPTAHLDGPRRHALPARLRGSALTCAFTEAELGPGLRVGLGVLAERPAVDAVDLDEAAHRGRLVGAVEEDAPRGAGEEASPCELRARVADGEPDRARRDHQRLGLVDL